MPQHLQMRLQYVSTACQLQAVNVELSYSKSSFASVSASRMTTLTPPNLIPIPHRNHDDRMQGTRGTPSGRPRRFCWLATSLISAPSYQSETERFINLIQSSKGVFFLIAARLARFVPDRSVSVHACDATNPYRHECRNVWVIHYDIRG